jgi:hypothetical protein
VPNGFGGRIPRASKNGVSRASRYSDRHRSTEDRQVIKAIAGSILAAWLVVPGASPALASGPDFSIAGAERVGLPLLTDFALNGPPCGATGRARIDVTFTDPDGIAYAAVSLGAARTDPAVSDFIDTTIWLPFYAKSRRDYRWRYEDAAATRTAHTIPIVLDLIPTAGPIPAEIMAKDGRGRLTSRTLALRPAPCR